MFRELEYAATANLPVYRLSHTNRYNGPMINRSHGDPQDAMGSFSEIELMTIKEVAEFLKVSVSMVRRLQQGRKIAFIKVGGSIRFNKPDVVQYLRQQTIKIIC
jgi:excisionase family DNA binding protein